MRPVIPACARRLHPWTGTTRGVAGMTSTRWSDDTARVRAIAVRRRTVERRREALENLQRLSVLLEGASTLDRRAGCSNPVLSGLLRERAEERRRVAAVIRAHLDER